MEQKTIRKIELIISDTSGSVDIENIYVAVRLWPNTSIYGGFFLCQFILLNKLARHTNFSVNVVRGGGLLHSMLRLAEKPATETWLWQINSPWRLGLARKPAMEFLWESDNKYGRHCVTTIALLVRPLAARAPRHGFFAKLKNCSPSNERAAPSELLTRPRGVLEFEY
jgi:hypothetical protein